MSHQLATPVDLSGPPSVVILSALIERVLSCFEYHDAAIGMSVEGISENSGDGMRTPGWPDVITVCHFLTLIYD
jgi:hypothetical protein